MVSRLFKGLVKFQFPDDTPHGGLGNLDGCKLIIIDSIGGFHGIDHLQVKDPIHLHGDIIPGNTDLGGHINGLFLQGMAIAEPCQ